MISSIDFSTQAQWEAGVKQVIQHAQPAWVAPQHLAVFIPDAAVAVEYMGRQHFELHIVRYDDDVGARDQEIADKVAGKLTQ